MEPEVPTISVKGMVSETEKTKTVPLTDYNTNKMRAGCLFCFIEGKTDTDYYMAKVKSICGNNVYYVKCNCKKNVLFMYDEVYESDHITNKLAFFIDHDFDSSISRPGLYETESYSIENYYTYPSVFEEFLQYGLQIDVTSVVAQSAMSFYVDEFDKFHHVMLEYNAWIAACKAKQETREMHHLNPLKNTPVQGFVTINFGNAYTQNYNVDDLNSHFQASPQITATEVISKVSELQSKDPYVTFRGKYEYNHLINLLKFMRKKAVNKSPNSRNTFEKELVCWDINPKHMLKYYSAYAYMPDRLRQFLLQYKA